MSGTCDDDEFTGIPVAATKLIVVDKVALTTKAKAVYVAKDLGSTKGSGTNVATIDARLDFTYDATSGAFVVPAGASNGTDGWKVNKKTVAKYVNKPAPAGPTQAKVAVIKPGKLAKVVGKGLGDEPIDLIGAGAPTGSVYTAFAVTNGGDTFTHCSEFTPGNCAFKEIAAGTGRKLVCKRGVGDASCLAITGP